MVPPVRVTALVRVCPDDASSPPLLTVMDPVPRALAVSASTTPALIVDPPVNAPLVPDRINQPAPVFVRFPAPDRVPLSVSLPLDPLLVTLSVAPPPPSTTGPETAPTLMPV